MLNETKESQQYFQHLSEGIFALPHCQQCDTTFLPPRVTCPACLGTSLGWKEIPHPRGQVYSLTRMSNGKTVALVDLDDVTGMGRLFAEVAETAAENMGIGDRVTVDIVERESSVGTHATVLNPES